MSSAFFRFDTVSSITPLALSLLVAGTRSVCARADDPEGFEPQ